MSAVAHGRVRSVIEGMQNNQETRTVDMTWADEYRARAQAMFQANRARLTPEQHAALDVAVARLEALGGDLVEHLKAHVSPEEFDALVPPEQYAARQRMKAYLTERSN